MMSKYKVTNKDVYKEMANLFDLNVHKMQK